MRTSNCWYASVCQSIKDGCDDTCIRYKEMMFLTESSGIPESRRIPIKIKPPSCDYDAFTRLNDIKSNMDKFVFDGSNLYLCSSTTGNGKTTWAIKLLLKYFDCVWAGNGFRVRGLFVHIPSFLLQCKDFNNHSAELDEFKKRLQTVDVVVWDDIASTDISSYDYSQLLMYIDARVSNNKSNIFTGNIVGRQALQKALGDKLTSRILSEKTEVITFNGGDKR